MGGKREHVKGGDPSGSRTRGMDVKGEGVKRGGARVGNGEPQSMYVVPHITTLKNTPTPLLEESLKFIAHGRIYES